MEKRERWHELRTLVCLLLLAALYSCASIGTPNGGPYDEAPPKYITSIPKPNQTNFKGRNIEITFDELIQLDKPSENVIITPPQMELPVIRTSGRKIQVELKDTLQSNTTYTLDFTNSISDNNEKNILENYSFAFSTGDMIDTLEVSGILLNAENLEPMSGITIGLHRNLEDSAFVKVPFARTSRTNERGRFTIRNIAEGTYRIYALNDVNRDYKFDQPGEDIAFNDALITPTFEMAIRQDTIWKDSLTVDSIKLVEYTHYLPDDILLQLFKEKFERQYMLRPERSQENKFTIRYNAVPDTIPLPVLLNDVTPTDSGWYFVQTEEAGKTVHFWVTDSMVWKQDTLSMAITYPRSDSLNILRPQTDTLNLTARRQPAPRRPRRGEEETPKTEFLSMQFTAAGSINIFDTVAVTFNEPVLELPKELFVLNQKVDTIWTPVEFELTQDSINSLRYLFTHNWNYGEEYRLQADSATIFSIYNKWNDKYTGTFGIKKKEDYGNLFINIEGVDTTAFVQLLNTNDQPVRQAPVQDGGALFMDLKPDKYYVRLIVDTNGNGKWDTGNYAEKRHAEQVFYSSKLYEVIQNWDVEETWDVTATPLDLQKPLEITKNKPKEATKQQRDYRNEGRSTSSGSSGRSGGLPF